MTRADSIKLKLNSNFTLNYFKFDSSKTSTLSAGQDSGSDDAGVVFDVVRAGDDDSSNRRPVDASSIVISKQLY